MKRSTDNPWLTRFAALTAVATLGLICLGGLVTSHGAGMSVPDWPTTYGYNMFFFPVSKWVGGIFYEHTHRLAASAVGFMTIILAVWLGLREARGWLRWLGLAAVVLVILQGVLGGLRVTALKDELGIFHAALAQLFLVLLFAIALFTTRWWQRLRPAASEMGGWLRLGWAAATVLILVQLVLGASMRHQHAGLAIPDFPLAYGNLWPDTSSEAIVRYNQQRIEVRAMHPITAAQVLMQMAHRGMAVVILVLVGWIAVAARRSLGRQHVMARGSLFWAGLIAGQALLGAATIWTNKSADIATAHVAVGAITLVTGSLLVLVAGRLQPAVAAAARLEPCEVAA